MKPHTQHLVLGAVVALAAVGINIQVSSADDGPTVSIGTMQVSPKKGAGKRSIGPTIKLERPHLNASTLDASLKPGQVQINMQKPDTSTLHVGAGAPVEDQQPQQQTSHRASSRVPGSGHASKGTATVIPVRMNPPQYPREALISGRSGKVVVQFTVLPNGSTQNVRVLSSNPPGIFDKAARHAVINWKFKPMSSPARVKQTINFVPPR